MKKIALIFTCLLVSTPSVHAWEWKELFKPIASLASISFGSWLAWREHQRLRNFDKYMKQEIKEAAKSLNEAFDNAIVNHAATANVNTPPPGLERIPPISGDQKVVALAHCLKNRIPSTSLQVSRYLKANPHATDDELKNFILNQTKYKLPHTLDEHGQCLAEPFNQKLDTFIPAIIVIGKKAYDTTLQKHGKPSPNYYNIIPASLLIGSGLNLAKTFWQQKALA